VRPRLLFVQPSLNPGGGGNGVAAWMLQALAQDFDCTLLTLETPRFDMIDRYYGTALSGLNVAVACARPLLSALLDRLPFRLDLLKSALLFAEARSVSATFDLAATASNEADLGAPGIQYVHYPARLYPRPDADIRWFHFSWLLRMYRALATQIQPASRDAIARNMTLVNSAWVGGRMREAYGVAGDVVHPPVVWNGPAVSWEAREPGFVTVGRRSPEKDFEKIIRILSRVRANGYDVHLHIVANPDRHNRAYARAIERDVRRGGDWITLHDELPRGDLQGLLATQRFGIHGMIDEHFGMAIAEMVRAGCLVFVPAGGGQKEIVDDDRLQYGSEDEAVTKICEVLENDDLQAALRWTFGGRAEKFAPERFMTAIREAARRQLRAAGQQSAATIRATSAAAR
jgi:glycosyltransferase involved in cell wall biosynthesis